MSRKHIIVAKISKTQQEKASAILIPRMNLCRWFDLLFLILVLLAILRLRFFHRIDDCPLYILSANLQVNQFILVFGKIIVFDYLIHS